MTRIDPQSCPHRLAATGLAADYGRGVVIDGLDVVIPDGSFTAIIGPNACGKSTLLRALARLLRPRSGTVLLDGTDVSGIPPRRLARVVGLLPQSPVAPNGITVTDLVARGRYPHQSVFAQWTRRDEETVHAALSATGTLALAARQVDELSGGQRQRVWIAMTLAQDTPILLLDEPTTYLDITHQIEILELVEGLRRDGRTVIAVLHDLNHAARYATHLIAMRDGRILAQGTPREVITAERIEEVFGLRARVIEDPDTATPIVLPRSSVHSLR